MANPFIRFKTRTLDADQIAEILKNEYPNAKIHFNERMIHKLNRNTGVMEKISDKQIFIDRDEKCGACLEIEDERIFAKPRMVETGFLKMIFGSGNAERKKFMEEVLRTLLKYV